jgi:hypothetical protein
LPALRGPHAFALDAGELAPFAPVACGMPRILQVRVIREGLTVRRRVVSSGLENAARVTFSVNSRSCADGREGNA